MELNIKVNKICLMEEVETEEATQILEEAKSRFKIWKIVPSILLSVFLPLFFVSLLLIFAMSTNGGVIAFCVIMGILAIGAIITAGLCFGKYKELLEPFYNLLEVAKLNDKIRHEEKVREMERQRLQSGDKKELFNVADISNTINKSHIYDELIDSE